MPGVAGDDAASKAKIMELVDSLGFDPVDGGTLKESWRQQPSSPVYCTDLSAQDIKAEFERFGLVRTPEHDKEILERRTAQERGASRHRPTITMAAITTSGLNEPISRGWKHNARPPLYVPYVRNVHKLSFAPPFVNDRFWSAAVAPPIPNECPLQHVGGSKAAGALATQSCLSTICPTILEPAIYRAASVQSACN